MPSTLSQVIASRVPNAEADELRELAKQLDRTPSSIVATAIRRQLPELREAARAA